MIKLPEINPVVFSIGGISVYWYGIAYVIGIGFSWLQIKKHSKELSLGQEEAASLITYATSGILLGGRIFYIVLYNLSYYLENPWSIINLQEGGMSFHGALVGLALAIYLFARKYKVNWVLIAEVAARSAPVGICLGRVANYINGELYGKPTSVPWAVIFPQVDMIPRHPSQLYEAILEGPVLFCLLRAQREQNKARGFFLIYYSMFRAFTEAFRETETCFLHLSLGQVLSIPMFLAGIFLIRRKVNAE